MRMRESATTRVGRCILKMFGVVSSLIILRVTVLGSGIENDVSFVRDQRCCLV